MQEGGEFCGTLLLHCESASELWRMLLSIFGLSLPALIFQLFEIWAMTC